MKITEYLFIVMCLTSFSAVADEFPQSHLEKIASEYESLVTVDLSELEPGEIKKIVSFKGWSIGAVWVYHRTDEDMEYLTAFDNLKITKEEISDITDRLRQNYRGASSYYSTRVQIQVQAEMEVLPYRSKTDNFFVFLGYSPSTGCELTDPIPDDVRSTENALFFDACSVSTWDSAGRSQKSDVRRYEVEGNSYVRDRSSIPNLKIPPHWFEDENTLVLGVADVDSLPDVSYNRADYVDLPPTDKLMAATVFNDLALAKEAIADGADIDPPIRIISNYVYNVPLMRSVLSSSIEMVELLLSEGAIPKQNHIEWAERLERYSVAALLKEHVKEE